MPTSIMKKDDIAEVQPSPAAPARLAQLDSLRGLAALTVFFGHFAQLWPVMATLLPPVTMPAAVALLRYSPLSIFIAGQSAVLLFFILSGLVLSLPFLKAPVAYHEFAVKRICRIWLPYVACLLICLVIRHFTFTGSGFPAISSWFNDYIRTHITPYDFIAHLSLIGFFDSAKFNLISWSLVVEMRISLIFPLLVLLTMRLRPLTVALLALPMLLLPKIMSLCCHIPAVNDLAETVGFLPCFLLGILLAKHRGRLSGWWETHGMAARLGIILLGVLCYTAPNLWSGLPHFTGYKIGVFISGLAILGAGIFIAVALTSFRAQRLLSGSAIVFLGRISYSFYLYHAAIMMGMLNITRATLPMPFLFLLSLAAAIFISTLSYHYVELPSIALGKTLVNRMRHGRGDREKRG